MHTQTTLHTREAELTDALGVTPEGHTEHGAPIYRVPSWQLDQILGHIPDRYLLAVSVNEVQERRIAAEHRFVLAFARVARTPMYDAIVSALLPAPPVAAVEVHPRDCPECQAGKHPNCAGEALDPDTDALVPCECAEGGHL